MARSALLLVLVLWPTMAGAKDQPELPKQLTLSQALTIALTNNGTIQTAQARLEQASSRYVQSRSTLFPQLEANAQQSYLTLNLKGLGLDIPTAPQGKIGPFGSMYAGVTLTQDLLNIANLQAWKSSRVREDSSRLLVDNAREVVVLDVVAAYLQALRAKASQETLAEQTRLANELYKITEDQVKQGVSAPLESNRAQQQVNSLTQQFQEAEESYLAAKLTLANLLQSHITTDFEVADEAAYGSATPLDREAALSAALAWRPDYRSAQANIQAAELQLRSVKADRLPTVSTSFSDGQSGDSPENNVNTYRLTGSLNFPIYTGGRIHGEIGEAQAVLREAQARADQLRSQIETDVLTAAVGVEWALKELETSTVNVTLSRQELELTRGRFTQGVTDNTEVVNAQDRISKADDAHVRAQYTLGLARANLARATGTAEKTYRK